MDRNQRAAFGKDHRFAEIRSLADFQRRIPIGSYDTLRHYIEASLRGAKFDLIETGGGAASDTVISPKLHREFCLPYDRQLHRALHEAGHRVTYHTCGGMMNILDLVVENETDASETACSGDQTPDAETPNRRSCCLWAAAS